MVRVLANARQTGIHSQVESYQRLQKWFLILSFQLLSFSLRITQNNKNPLVLDFLINFRSGFLTGLGDQFVTKNLM